MSRNDERIIVGPNADKTKYDTARVTDGDLHTRVKLRDENNDILKGSDMRNIDIRNLLELVLMELKIINLHLTTITDENINAEEG